MKSNDRHTNKQLKEWCYLTILKYVNKKPTKELIYADMIDLMYKAYKRGYQDALSG